MTTATETQPTTRETKTMMRHASDCSTQVSGWAGEICNCHPREYAESTPTQPAITLSNFRVVYHAPRYEDGRVLYDGYCAILADDAALDGAEVRVFNVPDVDEGQLAAALFACDAMNRYPAMLAAVKKFIDAYSGPNAGRLGNGQARRSLDEFQSLLATTTSK